MYTTIPGITSTGSAVSANGYYLSSVNTSATIANSTAVVLGSVVTSSYAVTASYALNGGGGGGNGTSGTSGASGTSGTSGINGTSGTSGAAGASGTSGTSGATGASGTSGTSGASGTSGTSAVTASKVLGGTANYIPKWVDTNTLNTSSIIEDSTNTIILRNLKVTGSVYQSSNTITIPYATHNDQWLRVAKYNNAEAGIYLFGGWGGYSKFRILANPGSGGGTSNRGNWADVSIINAGYNTTPSIAVENAYTYGVPVATKIRSGKDGINNTWFVDVYLENISASATLDQLQVTLLDGELTLLSELNPASAGTSSAEASLLYPNVVSSTSLPYNYRVEGKTLLSGSTPLTVRGLSSGTDTTFLTIDTTGIVKTNTTASYSLTSSFALNGGGSGTSGTSGVSGTSGTSGTGSSVSSSYSVTSSYALNGGGSGGGNYLIPFGNVIAMSPADSTTYYVGPTNFRTIYAQSALRIPVAGTITSYWFRVAATSAAGSSENVNIYLRLNDTTDIGSINETWDSAYQNTFSSSMSQAVSAGDTVAVKVVTPAWVSNPAAVYVSGYINITT